MTLVRKLALGAAVPVALALVWTAMPSIFLDAVDLRHACSLPNEPKTFQAMARAWHRPNNRFLFEHLTDGTYADPGYQLMAISRQYGIQDCGLALEMAHGRPSDASRLRH
jgi:hypothetical protein